MKLIKELNPDQRNKLLKKIYTEIVRGYSTLTWDNSLLFVKHSNHFDTLDTELYYNKKYDYALSRGMPKEEDRLKKLYDQNLWSHAKDNEINSEKQYLEGLRKSRAKLVLQEDKIMNKEEVEKSEKKINDLVNEKIRLIGRTCESYATQKQNEYYLMHTLYKDPNFTQLFYEFDDFDDLDGYELNELFAAIYLTLDDFSEINVKHLAIAPFFQNTYSLCESVYEFFGKPISQLSFYQINLSIYGSNYKFMLSQSENIPNEIKEDPEIFESWYNDQQNYQKIQDKAGGATNIIGVSGKDRKGYINNSNDNVIDLDQMLKDKPNISKQEITQAMMRNV